LAGRTGVLLAGGPSLDAALEWVQQHRDVLVVLAVSRISRRLLEVGLEPDFVLSVDPTQMSYEVSRDMLRFSESVIFINQHHVNPQLLGQWPHRSFFLGQVLPWGSPLNPPEPLTGAGPTVTNTALEFAGALGLSRVILAGVDLCFTPEGHTHAQGSNERKVGPRFDLTQLEVQTNDGQRASTTADFASAIQMLGQQAQCLQQRGMEIINPAPGAARIPGVAHRPLGEIVVTDPPLARPLRVGGDPDTPERRLRHAQAVTRELQRRLDEIGRLEVELQHARRIAGKLFDASGAISNRNLRKRLDRLEREIHARYPDTATLIRQCGTHAFLRALKSTQDVDSLDAAAVQEALTAYYDTYLEGAARLRDLVRRGIDKARLRAREYGNTVSLPELASRWLALREPGRHLRWQLDRTRRGIPLTPAEVQTLDTLRQAWEDDLRSEGGQHLARARAHADLRAAGVRLERLFAQGKADGIRNVIAALEQVPNTREAAAYVALARGLLADLDGRTDDALGHYDTVLQSEQRALWPSALLRIADWALRSGQPQHARQALECLAGLSPRYRPQYADVLAATGDLQSAIDVYERHIADHPGDIHSMARLARLMINAGAPDAARLMLEHIERQPHGAEWTAPLRSLLEAAQQGSA
ncbi:MAG: 6-hydroxymethylpterin diphosphokinase MptE-like protein, partial [Tepidimonas sp.]|uniref:6-hydroxymethylpterin diphosphokinase MptE-like protein n=1 Tax=Tepidimonas sp. TaxID=2002775 RepID=UPI004054B0BB